MKNNPILDNEELKLLNAIESDDFIDFPLSESDKIYYQSNAKYTKSLQKKKQTTIRFSISDLAIIKSKSKKLGIGYQNLIQALVHDYAMGNIKISI